MWSIVVTARVFVTGRGRVVPYRQAREERKARVQAPEAGPARPGWQVACPCCAGLT